MKFIQFSDIHFGAEDPAAIEAATDFAQTENADATIICGDLTQRGKQSEFLAARNWLDTLPGPKLTVAGNHDTPLLHLWHRARKPFSRYASYFEAFEGPLIVKGVRFCGLNTSRGWQFRRNWAEGAVRLRDLDEILDGKTYDAATVIACHHPFLSPPGSPLNTRTRRGRRASKRLMSSGVQLLLTGHVHTPSVTFREGEHGSGYLSVSAGTLSRRLREAPPSFNVIELDDDTISINIHSFRNGQYRLDGRSVWPR
ncbi:metallophosphoesterase family protein [Ponticaulis profundi]|uniref:Metallophosphoesterase family protein n=1 Tax=Ponticaulis profundi TaxID=2665222 RepID=A0ABW1SF67_9PROT